MRIVPLAALLLSFTMPLLAQSRTIDLVVVRGPAEAVKKGGLAPNETLKLPLDESSCDDRVTLSAIDYRLFIKESAGAILIEIGGSATLEKLAPGPLAAPTLLIHMQAPDAKHSLSFAFESSMTKPEWEGEGTFREGFESTQMLEAKFWKSLELRCASSPYRAAAIPDHVTYKPAPDAKVAAAAAALAKALHGGHAFADPALHGDDPMVIVGPDLYAGIRTDPALSEIKGPKVVTLDPATGKQRDQLRVKGAGELAIFASALRRHTGDAPPRIRAATHYELAKHWLNIGWDIQEPLLVADYGKRRLIVTYLDGAVFMIDELP